MGRGYYWFVPESPCPFVGPWVSSSGFPTGRLIFWRTLVWIVSADYFPRSLYMWSFLPIISCAISVYRSFLYRSFSTGWFRTDPTPHLDIFYRFLCTDLLDGSFEDRVYRCYLNSSRCLPIRSLIRMFSTDCFAPISSQGSFLPLLIQRSFSSNPILQNACAHPFFKDRLYRFFSGGRFWLIRSLVCITYSDPFPYRLCLSWFIPGSFSTNSDPWSVSIIFTDRLYIYVFQRSFAIPLFRYLSLNIFFFTDVISTVVYTNISRRKHPFYALL